MPICTTAASERARAEAAYWAEIAEHWRQVKVPELWADRPPTEKDTVIFYDPTQDIAGVARDWGHRVESDDLSSLALFAAGLAVSEERGWDDVTPDIATRAYEARRFLIGDRIVHWAVPWLDAVGHNYARHAEVAFSDRDLILGFADEAKVAPATPGSEGLFVDGEDSYGPIEPAARWSRWTESLWSGAVVLQSDRLTNLFGFYERAAGRWAGYAAEHIGTAQLWIDLSKRAATTSQHLKSR
jgi:hypothetical protein